MSLAKLSCISVLNLFYNVFTSLSNSFFRRNLKQQWNFIELETALPLRNKKNMALSSEIFLWEDKAARELRVRRSGEMHVAVSLNKVRILPAEWRRWNTPPCV